MTNILKQVEMSRHSRFLPTSPDEYFALRLATALGEPSAARHYAMLASQYPQHKLLQAYQHALSSPAKNENAARQFHDYLQLLTPSGYDSVPRPRLMAVRVERRCVAIAVFAGTHLEGFRLRHLGSDRLAADTTTAEFIGSTLYENNCQSIAIETVSSYNRRSELKKVVIDLCRSQGVSVWEVSPEPMMQALSHPPLKTRAEIRQQMRNIWPAPDLKASEACVSDAFALGLYVQTERLFGADLLNGHSN